MTIGRNVPPAAAPVTWKDLWHGVIGLLFPERSLRLFEEEIRAHFGVSHVFLVSSGTAALTLTLMALKSSSRRTDVVIPAYTCFSVPAAVLKAGLRPVLCDINPSTFDFDHALLERTLNDDTLVRRRPSPVRHPVGHRARSRAVPGARHLRRRRRGAGDGRGIEGRKLGTLGDVGIFSLGRGKNITCGSGGIVVTNSAQIADALGRRWRQLERRRSGRGAEGLRPARPHGDLHPAAPLLDSGRAAVSPTGPDDLPEGQCRSSGCRACRRACCATGGPA